MSHPEPTVEDLFHACRALRTQSERAAYLDRVTAGNPSLRTRVEQLLAADAAEDTSFLQPKPAANAAKVRAGEQAGQMIDRYKLLQELGEGGMGTVWMAEQREPVVRKVALKIIKLGMDTREVVVRFEAERQALALMDHPHIAKVLDGGSTTSGRPYFVMELVKGVPITEYADQAKLGLRERLELFTKVCEAIQHAHHKGIIHRDIKPTNVLVTLHDGIAVPKVIDFGIAKATSAELTKKTLFTQYAQVLGTPEYMAPEQAEMSGLDIDTRADVYSLGVLLYELLTGQKPFDIQQALAVGFQELLRTIREDDPQKPSTRVSTLGERASPVAAHRELNVESWSKRLRGDLDWIVMKALEKDRARRYDTPNGFAQDIGRFLRHEAVIAAPPSAAYRLRKLVQRRRKTVVAVAAIALLLVAGIVGTSWGLYLALVEKGRADVAATAARLAKEEAETHATRAEAESQRARAAEAAEKKRADELAQVASFQETQLGSLDAQQMGIRLRQDLLAQVPAAQRDALAQSLTEVNFTNVALHSLEANLFRQSLAAIDAQFQDQPLVHARLLQVTATVLRRTGLLDLAQSPQERALAIRTRTLGADDPETLGSLRALGILRDEQGRMGEAEQIVRDAFERSLRVLGPEHPDTLQSKQAVGAMLRKAGRFAEARQVLAETLEAQRRVGGEDGLDTLHTSNSLCVLLAELGAIAEAEPLLRSLVESQLRVHGADHLETTTTKANLATALANLGRLPEACALHREVFATHRRMFGDDSPHTLQALVDLGSTLDAMGEPREGARCLQQAIDGMLRTLGAEHVWTLLARRNLGKVMFETGNLEAAELQLRAALDGCRRVLGDDHTDTLKTRTFWAVVCRLQGRHAEAVEHLRAILTSYRRQFGVDSVYTLQAMNDLGGCLWSLGDPAAAIPYLRESLEGRRKILGTDHAETLSTAGNLGVNLRDAGEPEAALPLLEEAWRGRQMHPKLVWVGTELLTVLVRLGRTEAGKVLVDELVREKRATVPADSVELASLLSSLGRPMCDLQLWAEAEVLLRECVAIREAKQPELWNTWNAKSLLGGALLGQRQFAAAETLLLAGCEGMQQRESVMPADAKLRIPEAMGRLVALYTAWEVAEPGVGHAAKAAVWRERAAARTSGGGR